MLYYVILCYIILYHVILYYIYVHPHPCVYLFLSLSLFLSIAMFIVLYWFIHIFSVFVYPTLSNHLIDWCVFIYLSHWSQKSQCSKWYAMDGMGWWTMHKNDFWQKNHNWRWKSSISVNSKYLKMIRNVTWTWHILVYLAYLRCSYRHLEASTAWSCLW